MLSDVGEFVCIAEKSRAHVTAAAGALHTILHALALAASTSIKVALELALTCILCTHTLNSFKRRQLIQS